VWSARFRFASLWLSQVARVMADNCLRMFLVLLLSSYDATFSQSGWHLLAALQMLPAVFFAPLNGALSNSLPKRWVLVATAAYCAGVVALFGVIEGPWIAGWTLLAVGGAIYGPTRYALLPAAADDTRVPLTRITGWIELGAVTAIVAGLSLGLRWHEATWHDVPLPVVFAVACNAIAVLAALPVWFAADIRRAESAGRAIVGFFRDTGRVYRDPKARGSLLALALLRALVAGMTGALVAVVLGGQRDDERLIEAITWICLGVAVGSLLAGWQRHPRRVLGLVPLGASGLVVGLICAALGSIPSPFLCAVLGAMGGLVNVPLAATYQASVPGDARGNAMAVRNMADYVLMTGLSFLLFMLSNLGILAPAGQLWLIAGLAAIGAVMSWHVLYRQSLELLMELLICPIYRVRGHGPGLEQFPARGPMLVIANHCAWFDPFWVGKVVPRRIIPMMTSAFYDLPGLNWLMLHVVHAIRVQASTYRREAPELRKAIAALDRGQCVVIFPEGGMRRREENYLRQFGQGVWHILRERPTTPVAVCWIEGGWGSFFSYFRGPPTKNKRFDFWRRIDIAVGPVHTLDPDLFSDHRTTRAHLMRLCLETRRYLGLEPLGPPPSVDELVPAGEDLKPETI
jgi:acyl-[acyl-carrier-protein]-phospholipid O-acyltransferase/long-chain-fatty-acid--[acyl-carrier-protein] ligase